MNLVKDTNMKLEDFTHNLNAKDYVIGYASPRL